MSKAFFIFCDTRKHFLSTSSHCSEFLKIDLLLNILNVSVAFKELSMTVQRLLVENTSK